MAFGIQNMYFGKVHITDTTFSAWLSFVSAYPYRTLPLRHSETRVLGISKTPPDPVV